MGSQDVTLRVAAGDLGQLRALLNALAVQIPPREQARNLVEDAVRAIDDILAGAAVDDEHVPEAAQPVSAEPAYPGHHPPAGDQA